MNTYKYVCKDTSGQSVNGTLDGISESEIAQLLHRQGLIVVSIEQVQAKTAGAKSKGAGIKLDDLLIFSRQLATMIDAGIPLVQALGILSEQIENPSLRKIVGEVRQDIEAGMSFCDALAKHPRIFSELYINMVRAGEASGMLDDVLDRLATYMEKQAALIRKVSASLIYPAVIICMATAITALLLLKVVPTFKSIFDTLGGNLPLPTLILIGISDLFRKQFLFLVIALTALVIFLKKYVNTEKGRFQFDNAKLNLPVLGPLFRKLAIAKFARTFSTLSKSGVSVLNALEIVSKTSGNVIVEHAVTECSKSVRDGEPIYKPLEKSKVFPPMVCRMISVGEQTGQLEKMLSKIADFYDEQVDAAATGLASIIEPLVISVLGVVVGGIVISLFLPVFKISQMISR